MCSTTKQKIASALHQMMMERPFQKITVQNLMDASGMKRQSFYYHFQDTRDVLQWICRQELILPLESSELDFEGWILYALELLEKDRSFYRRMFAVGDTEIVHALGDQLLVPRLSQLLYGAQDERRLDPGQQFTVSFGARAVTAYAVDFVHSRRTLDPAQARGNLRCLLTTLGLEDRREGA